MSWYRFFRGCVALPIRLFMRVKVSGRDNLPKQGPYILAVGSHQTALESFAIPVYFGDIQVHFFAKAELWKFRIMAWFMNATGQVPVKRRSASGSKNPAVDAGVKVLNDGEVLLVYPEGTFTRDRFVHRGRTGVAHMSMQADVPIIPVGLVGMERLNPSGLWMRPGRAEIRIGKPIDPKDFYSLSMADVSWSASEERAKHITNVVMNSIAALAEKQYEDSYSRSRKRK